MVEVEEVKSAIDALQQPNQTVRANQWLSEFARTNKAWPALENLLISKSHRLFAAVTLYGKVQRDLNQLNQIEVEDLLDRLVKHLLLCASEQIVELSVCRYLGLCIAAAAVQMQKSGIINSILTWLNPIISSNPKVVLELLISLPEECYNQSTDATDDMRELFSMDLNRSLTDVFDFLQHLTQYQDVATSNKISKCVERWIESTEVTIASIVLHPVFNSVVGYLQVPDLFEASVDVLIALWQRFGLEAFNYLFATVMQLAPLWNSQLATIASKKADDIDDDVLNVFRMISRLVTVVGESCMAKVFNDSEDGVTELLSFLLRCSQFPFDFNISRIPLKVFYDLSTVVRSRGYDCSEVVRTRLVQVYGALLEGLVSQLALPEDVLQGALVLSDSLEDKRYELVDSISDCCVVLGPSLCSNSLCALLQREMDLSQQAGQTVQWARIEAILSALQVCIEDLPLDDSELNIQILSFVKSLPDLPALKVVSVNVVGKIAGWLRRNEAFIQPQIVFLSDCLGKPLLALAAARAIANICKQCSQSDKVPAELILNYHRQRDTVGLPLEAESYMIEGLCYLVMAMPATVQADALEQVICPIRTSFGTHVASKSGLAVMKDIDAVTTVYRFLFLDVGDHLTHQFLQLQPLLEAAMEALPEERVCEKACRCYKYVFKNVRRGLYQYIPAISATLAQNFRTKRFSAFIYAAAICFSTYINEGGGQLADALYAMLWSLSSDFFASMGQLSDFEQRPDLVEEYFYFVARALECYPDPLVHSS